MMNFADGFGLGRVCLVLGIALMAWGACREPMLPSRPAVVSRTQVDDKASIPAPPQSPGADEEMEENVPVIARRGDAKARR